MEKVLFLALAPSDVPPVGTEDVRRATSELVGALEPERFPGLTLQVEDHAATAQWLRRQRPQARRLVASLGAWTECADDCTAVEDLMTSLFSSCASFVVTESVPRWRVPRATSTDEPRPGVVVTSLLCRAPSMDRTAFVDHWRDVHQPLSMRIHPQVTYVRNVVARPLVADLDFVIDAVCEEGFLAVDDVLDPSRFFGADRSGPTWQENATTIGDDVQLFLDADHTSAAITREYNLRDLRPTLAAVR